MIVVVGSPVAQNDARGPAAAGLGVEIARVAGAAGCAVQLVARVGEDAPGDAILLALAADGIGHAAVLREPGRPTPVAGASDEGSLPTDDVSLRQAIDLDESEPPDVAVRGASASASGLSLDAADLDLALRYLPDYRVVILACDLDESARATVVGAASWAGAHLVAIVSGAADAASLPPGATVFERPAGGPDGSFAATVAAYAVALDRGTEPAAAFAEAVAGGSWSGVTDSADNPTA